MVKQCLDKCCGCISLEYGGYIIIVLTLVNGGIDLYLMEYDTWKLYVQIVIKIIMVGICVLGVFGIYKKIPKFLLPLCVFCGVNIIAFTIVLIMFLAHVDCIVNDPSVAELGYWPAGLILFLYILLQTYYLLVMVSLYLNVKKENDHGLEEG